MRWLLLLALLAVIPDAGAVVFHDAETGLSIDLSVPDADVCYLHPRELRDEASCSGLNAAAQPSIPVNTRLAAAVRGDAAKYTVVGNWLKMDSPEPLTREEAQSLLTEATSGGAVTPVRAEPDLLIINGLQVVRFAATLNDPKSPIKTMITYYVVGRSNLVSLAFVTASDDVAQLQDLAEKSMATLKMPLPPEPARWQTRDEQVSSHVRVVLSGVLTLAALCLGAVWLYQLLRRKLANDPRQP